MRNALASIAVVCAVMIAATAFAQPRPSRRRAPTRRGSTSKPPPDKGPDPRVCRSREAALQNDQRRLDEWKARVAGISSEIRTLRDSIKRLDTERTSLQRSIGPTETRVAQQKKTFDEQCKANEDCSRYERMAQDLGRRTKPTEDAMDRMRQEISATRTDVANLRRTIEPLRNEYNQKKCNKLVPGETSQETIDRCTAIFSEWNRVQGDLNRQNDRLARLQSTYQSLYTQLKSAETRAKGYETYLAKNCAKSKELQTVRRYSGVRQRAEALHRELDQVVRDVTKLRGIRITVE